MKLPTQPTIQHSVDMRKPFLLSLLGLLAARATALWPTAEHEQQPLTQAMRDKVPGSNNATFGPVPESQQIFKIDFLEIAPLPIPTYEQLD